MKKNMIIAMTAMFLLAGTFTANAQAKAKQQTTTIYTPEQVDQRAMFPGGQEGMMNYMMQNMKYPKEAEKDKARGTVVVHFVVEADGSISAAHVPDSQKVHPILDADAVAFVKAMPKWKPARLKGKAVRQRATHAISYRFK